MTRLTSAEGQPLETTNLGRTRVGIAQQGEQAKMRGELIDSVNSSVCNRKQAWNFLDRNQYVVKEDPISQESLSYALLSMVQSTMHRALKEGARAVVILIMDALAKSLGEQVMKYVEKRLELIMWKMDEATDVLREATYDTIQATDLAMDVVENGM